MSLLIWGAMFEVGVSDIDAQHRRLFDLANQLADAVRVGKGQDVLAEVLTELVRYTQTHFAFEEQLMSQHHYPAAAEHRQQHQELVQQVTGFKQRFHAGDQLVVEESLQFFTHWLSRHIMHIDKAFARDLKAKGVQ
ncbi:bacteriohemerythrin [Trichlorobacter ammonificans]|uniref:Hemerythrin-like metal-binding protein n=1 Tax=Trichlorobacter ammonificans TaxID=2916410 RepID=A0ABM9DAN7_9BACT|nr:bacteriohemerythrin [Trichlorobacter ammonificans]CAH2032298.1 Hemerythrin-like metal-binding protein [Trichlorobacter ammonificans]